MLTPIKISDLPQLLDSDVSPDFYLVVVVLNNLGIPVANARISIQQLANGIQLPFDRILLPTGVPDNSILVTENGELVIKDYISQTSIDNWDDAFSWGDHSLVGYLTQAVADNRYRLLSQSVPLAEVTGLQTALDNKQPLDTDLTAIAGLTGNSGLLRKTAVNTWQLDTTTYLSSESDPIFTASPAFGITNTNITNWNTAFSWGNHASAGYLLASAAATLYAPLSHTHAASDITSGTLSVIRGGTGLSSYTTGSYIKASGTSSLQEVAPATVLVDIGAAPLVHTHIISDVTGLQTALDGKQATLVSGTNIKTINGISLLGSGNIEITGGTGGATSLDGLSDVTISAPQVGHTLVYDGTDFKNSFVDYTTLLNVPSTFTPATHTHVISDITGLQTSLDGKQPLDGDLTAIAAISGTSGLLRKTAANTWTLDTNTYLTSFTETDPVFTASPAFGITNTQITNWNTAYGWGNHATAGYALDSQVVKLTGDQTITGIKTFGTINVTTVDFVPGSPEGNVSWNSEDATLDVTLLNGSVLQVGQEDILYARNETGSTMVSGQVVYITGAQGNRPTVELASATTVSLSNRAIGVVTSTILNNNPGYIAVRGLVRGLNTSSWVEGTILWLGTTAGQLTNVKPADPNRGVHIGVVVRSHASEGSIYVDIANSLIFEELDNVTITSAAVGNVPKWNGTVWANSFVDWSEITGKPSTFTPSAHTHVISDVTGLQTALDGKQALDADLTAIAALAGTSGLLRKTAADTWSLDTTVYAADNAVVKLTGDQTIAGVKTFSSTISGSINGNAATVTNGVYTTGNQTIGGTKTFSSQLVSSVATGTAPFSVTSTTRVTNLNVATAGTADTLTTARTITIGSTGKSFNGSSDISWSLAEIGAAAISHTHIIGDITGLQTALDGKQATLVSGTNIKTINGQTVLGSGDLTVTGTAFNGVLTGNNPFFELDNTRLGTNDWRIRNGISGNSHLDFFMVGATTPNMMMNGSNQTAINSTSIPTETTLFVRSHTNTQGAHIDVRTTNEFGASIFDAQDSTFDTTFTSIYLGYFPSSSFGTLFGAAVADSAQLVSQGTEVDNMLIGSIENIPVIFGNNSTERMRFAVGGNIGINNTTPSYTLDVTGAIGGSRFIESFASPTISTGALTLDLSTTNNFVINHNANITTLTISNAPASRAFGFTVRLDYTGAFTVNWPASIKWPSGIAPTLTSTNGKSDLFAFYTTDGGTTYYGVLTGGNL